MHVLEYSLKLSRPLVHHSAAFSIVVAGNQIDYFIAPAALPIVVESMQIMQFCAPCNAARSVRTHSPGETMVAWRAMADERSHARAGWRHGSGPRSAARRAGRP